MDPGVGAAEPLARTAARAVAQIAAAAVRGDWRRTHEHAEASVVGLAVAVHIVVEGDAAGRVALVLEVEPLARLYQMAAAATACADGAPGLHNTDVLVGFHLAEDPVEGEPPPPQQVEVEVIITTATPASERKTTLALSRDDVLVPAWLGSSMLPLCAMRHGTGVRVRVRPAETGRPCAVRIVCAKLRDRGVSLAVARSLFALDVGTGPGTLAAAVEGDEVETTTVLLPDLDRALDADRHSCRLRVAAERARTRCGATFRELVERVWSPDRVARGFVEPLPFP